MEPGAPATICFGSKVEAKEKFSERWTPGIVTNVNIDGTYDIQFETGRFEKSVSGHNVRSIETFATIAFTTNQQDLVIMSDCGDAYEVSCPEEPLVSGVYIRNATSFRYVQKNGSYTLAQHTTGQWGVGDGKVYLFLAKQASKRPNDKVSWQMLNKDRYIESPTMSVQQLISPAPDAAQLQPTEATTAAAPSAQSSHSYVENKQETTSVPSAAASALLPVPPPRATLHSAASLLAECERFLKQFAGTPQRTDLTRRINNLQAQLDAAARAFEFESVASLGTQMQALQQQSAQLPLSEQDYLTLGDRHAYLVRRVTDACMELMNLRDYAALGSLSAKLKELKALDLPTGDDNSQDPVLPDGDARTGRGALAAVDVPGGVEEDDGALDPVLPPGLARFGAAVCIGGLEEEDADSSAYDPVLPSDIDAIRKV